MRKRYRKFKLFIQGLLGSIKVWKKVKKMEWIIKEFNDSIIKWIKDICNYGGIRYKD